MTPEEHLKRFREMAQRHTAEHTVNRQAALDELVAEGIYTEDGELTPEFGGPSVGKRRGEFG